MSFVLQPWVSDVGLKMQSILLSGLRAPDQYAPMTKRCVRWLRAQCQIDADPGKQSYMQSVEMTEELIWKAVKELEYCTVHYTHHLADAFAVLSYHHPDDMVCAKAWRLHALIAEELFHFVPESRSAFLQRHRDKIT